MKHQFNMRGNCDVSRLSTVSMQHPECSIILNLFCSALMSAGMKVNLSSTLILTLLFRV